MVDNKGDTWIDSKSYPLGRYQELQLGSYAHKTFDTHT